MSSYALVLVVFGLLIAISRAPLVFAPGRTRDFYLKVMGDDGRMRLLGIFVALLGLFTLWGTGGVGTGLATFLYYVGWFMIAVGIGGMALFPSAVRPIAVNTWSKWSDSTLRILGTFAVTFGVLLAAYGLSL